MDLAIVLPCFNERKTILLLLNDLVKFFSNQNISWKIIAVNDGSTDDTLSILQSFAKQNPELIILNQPNSGHGPALINGYRNADADWVWQLDCDYDYELDAFNELWANRNNFDLLLAERQQKSQSLSRKIISGISAMMVKLAFGKNISDVNVPYRLIRNEKLQLFLNSISENVFAPNLLMSAYYQKKGLRIFTTSAINRKNTGRKSKLNMRLFKGCWQTVGDLLKLQKA